MPFDGFFMSSNGFGAIILSVLKIFCSCLTSICTCARVMSGKLLSSYESYLR